MFRIVIILAVLFTQTLSNHAQDFTSSLHVPRVGDKLQVEQVGFVLPGGSGTGQRWDFSRLDVIRPKHRISYVGEYDSSAFTEIEDMTMTYYSVRGDTLQLTGFESNTKEMCYATPELSMRFPLTSKGSSQCPRLAVRRSWNGLQEPHRSQSGRFRLQAHARLQRSACRRICALHECEWNSKQR